MEIMTSKFNVLYEDVSPAKPSAISLEADKLGLQRL